MLKRAAMDLMDIIAGLPSVSRRELPRESGIYFVLQGGSVVYVGKAVDLNRRWTGHTFRKDVDCGSLSLRWKPPDPQFCSLEHEEAVFVVVLRPKYNRIVKCRVWPIGSDRRDYRGLLVLDRMRHRLSKIGGG